MAETSAQKREIAELQRAIGNVAMASSRLEESLSRVLAFLAGSEEAWILFTGKPPRAAIEQAKAIIKERTGWRDCEGSDQVVRILEKSAALLELRNGVIHALWSFEAMDEERRFPWSEPDSAERLYYPARSRMNRGPSEYWVTVSDVDGLADRLRQNESELVEAVQASKEILSGFWAVPPTSPMWSL